MSRTISCLVPHDPVLPNGRQSQNHVPCSLPDANMLLCRDGGACCLYKEDDIKLGAGAIVRDVVTVGKVAIITSGAAYECGSVPAEPIKRINRYLNEAGRQICLSVKDGSL